KCFKACVPGRSRLGRALCLAARELLLPIVDWRRGTVGGLSLAPGLCWRDCGGSRGEGGLYCRYDWCIILADSGTADCLHHQLAANRAASTTLAKFEFSCRNHAVCRKDPFPPGRAVPPRCPVGHFDFQGRFLWHSHDSRWSRRRGVLGQTEESIEPQARSLRTVLSSLGQMTSCNPGPLA